MPVEIADTGRFQFGPKSFLNAKPCLFNILLVLELAEIIGLKILVRLTRLGFQDVEPGEYIFLPAFELFRVHADVPRS